MMRCLILAILPNKAYSATTILFFFFLLALILNSEIPPWHRSLPVISRRTYFSGHRRLSTPLQTSIFGLKVDFFHNHEPRILLFRFQGSVRLIEVGLGNTRDFGIF